MLNEAKRPSTVFTFARPLDAIFAPRNVAVIGVTDKAGCRTAFISALPRLGAGIGGVPCPV